MKRLFRFKLIPVCLLLLIAKPLSAGDDLEIIRKKVISALLEPSVNEAGIERLMVSIKKDGSWQPQYTLKKYFKN